jgi:cell wall-associated NlpC family hydrolase
MITSPPIERQRIVKKYTSGQKHWASDYIGMKWVNGARGPDTFDCWGLLCAVYKNHFNTILPTYAGIDAQDQSKTVPEIAKGIASGDWVKIDKPINGAAVALGANNIVTHVGIYLAVDRGHLLHAVSPAMGGRGFGGGVVCHRIETVRNRCLNVIGYYIPRTWPKPNAS